MNKNKNKKQIIVTISLIIVLILAVIGISYAAFSYVGRGEKVNQITTGTISMDYSESDNVISINNALPTTDETGKVRLREGEYFDFSVTTNLSGEAVINFEIAAEDFEDNTFDGSNVKFYLTKLVGSEEVEVSSNLPAVYSEQTTRNNKTGRPAGMMILLTGSTSTQGEETTNYRLRLYVDEKYNPQGDGGNLIFKTRINVYGKVATVGEPVMKNTGNSIFAAGEYIYYNDFDDYGGYELNGYITSIVIKDNLLVPDTALTNWDLSEAEDKSVIAYLENDGVNDDNTINYKLSIGGDGGVIAPTDSSKLFAGGEFGKMTEVDLHHLDTSFVQDMSNMFAGMSVDHLDLSSFDTSNVTTMQYMFQSCSATNIDLSSFDTSNVTNMSFMFCGCKSLTSLDLSNFDTSNVQNMRQMFEACWSLTSLNLISFNTSKITDMSSMFCGCKSLTTLDLSSFDTSKVTLMGWMFRDCSSLTTLDLTSFDTSSVMDMSLMFYNCIKMVSITVSNLWDTTLADNSETSWGGTKDMFSNCGIDHVTVVS